MVLPVADDEIHRHVERPFDIIGKAEVRRETEFQHAGALVVGVAPDVAAPALQPVRLALGEGRVGEQRRRERLQLQRHLYLAAHVGLALEVEIHLDRAGAVHHVEALGANLRHVAGHDLVARLRHLRRFGERPFRAAAEAEEADAERLGDLAHLCQMRIAFAAGLVDRFQRRAGKLELTAGLQRDRALTGRLDQADDAAGIHDRVPAELFLHAFEDGANAALPAVRHRRVAVDIEGELLVLGADPPFVAWLVARGQIVDEFVDAFDGTGIGCVARHEAPPSALPGNRPRFPPGILRKILVLQRS